jgi:mono/diheme cytochrome c family protein
MSARRTSSWLLLTLLAGPQVSGCEREVRDFHVPPAAANTSHSFRISELQPGTTQPSPHEQATTTTAPSTAPATALAEIIPTGTSPPPTTGQSLLPPPPPVGGVLPDDPTSELTPPPRDYSKNAFALSEGKRLFSYMNCTGCHANGGGGMGPALMDSAWIYGSSPEEVFATVVRGRPNGMPAFGGRLPDYQVWQLAHYVRSMSGLAQRDAAPSRGDRMKHRPPENTIEPAKPRQATTQ